MTKSGGLLHLDRALLRAASDKVGRTAVLSDQVANKKHNYPPFRMEIGTCLGEYRT